MRNRGAYMTDVIGKCRRHAAGYSKGGPSRIDKHLKDSLTWEASVNQRDLREEFISSNPPTKGYLIFIENRKNGSKTTIPVLVNKEKGLVKEATSEKYGILDDVIDCLHVLTKDGNMVEWESKQIQVIDSNAHSETELQRLEEENTTRATDNNQMGRRLQGHWRKRVEKLYGSFCQVTGIKNRCLLRGSHIKRWADSTTQERLDENNGLILSVHIDAAFEFGLISFDDSGKILLSSEFSEEDMAKLNISGSEKINDLTERTRVYLKWHRERHGFH